MTALLAREAGWWTASGNIGLPPLARVMGVGRQQQVEPIPENYDRFIGLIRVVSRRHIQRGCTYLVSRNSHRAYMKHKKQYTSNPFAEGTLETGNKLIDTMKEEKKKRWEEVSTSIDLTHNRLMADYQEAIQRPYLSKPSVSGQLQPSRTPSARRWSRNDANKG